MDAKIRHEGVIISINGDIVQVQFAQRTACAHCEAKSHCNSSESKEKIVEVECHDASSYSIGDNVIVFASQKVGYLAVLYGAVLPMAAMMAVTITFALTTKNELLAAFLGLGTLAAYFLCLYLMRGMLKRQLRFEINNR
ncbi:MAG: SoxR reducing system RseC family protein [Bacteroidaceae bacterium]|nr:SoxR reducing system RseC family protein [Bacteroidaceae bacterium]